MPKSILAAKIWLAVTTAFLTSLTRAESIIPPAQVVSKSVEPTYPEQAKREGIEGEVQIEYVIKEDGSVANARAIRSGNGLLQQAVIDAVLQRRFKPQQTQRENAGYQYTRVCYEFRLPKTPDEQPSVRQVDFPEQRWRKTLAPPVYPFDLLKKKKSGSALVSFTVTPGGRVQAVSIVQSTRREFGLAVQAQVEALTLPPLLDEQGNPQSRIEFFFREFSVVGNADVPLGKLARKLFLGPPDQTPKIYGAAEVDQRPVPVKTMAPAFPVSLLKKSPRGEALIEFIVDEEGTPQAIRIVSETKIEFGYAAAQAVSQWKFKPALKAGQPVPVRIEVPFEFRMNP